MTMCESYRESAYIFNKKVGNVEAKENKHLC